MSARIKALAVSLASALIISAVQPACAAGGPIASQKTKAGVIRVVKENMASTFFINNRLLYTYTQGDCAGIQWHGFSGNDELTLVYASSCGNGVGIYPTWRLIVVKPDKFVTLSEPLGDASDLRISQLGERVTFTAEKSIAGVYQFGQLTIHGKPVASATIPALE